MVEEPIPDRIITETTYGEPTSVEPDKLVKLLEGSKPEAKRAGAEAFARISATATERLTQYTVDLDMHLETDDTEVRAHLLCALASIAQERPSAVTISERVIECLQDDDAKVREWAALLIAYVGGPPAGQRETVIDQLVQLLGDDNAPVRRNACLGLAQMGQELDQVQRLLDDPDETVRETAKRIIKAGE
jgi:HEAT repeat protein